MLIPEIDSKAAGDVFFLTGTDSYNQSTQYKLQASPKRKRKYKRTPATSTEHPGHPGTNAISSSADPRRLRDAAVAEPHTAEEEAPLHVDDDRKARPPLRNGNLTR